tara:strand:- start:355 stop:561 length:207 start_codon:yes stop_codon:yes gene_type:complete
LFPILPAPHLPEKGFHDSQLTGAKKDDNVREHIKYFTTERRDHNKKKGTYSTQGLVFVEMFFPFNVRY